MIEELRGEVSSLNEKLSCITEQVDWQEQYFGRSCLLNHGINKENQENTDSLALTILKESAIGTPTYNLAEFCSQLLKPLISNDYTIKDYFSFAKEVLDFDASCFMASFDIK